MFFNKKIEKILSDPEKLESYKNLKASGMSELREDLLAVIGKIKVLTPEQFETLPGFENFRFGFFKKLDFTKEEYVEGIEALQAKLNSKWIAGMPVRALLYFLAGYGLNSVTASGLQPSGKLISSVIFTLVAALFDVLSNLANKKNLKTLASAVIAHYDNEIGKLQESEEER